MSAPSNKYSDEYIKGEVGGESRKLIRQALALAEYGSDAAFKQLFHLDAVTHRSDRNGHAVVIGMVGENSLNKRFHAEKRWARLRMTIGGISHILLNDSGLNTMPDTAFGTVVARYANLIKVENGYVKSAYYDATTQVLISAYNRSTGQWLFKDYVVERNIAAKHEGNGHVWIMENGQASYGDIIELTVKGVNAEGTCTSPNILTFECRGFVEFYQVYLVTSQSQQPESGTPYIVGVTADDWSRQNGLGYLFEQTLPAAWDAEQNENINVHLYGAPGILNTSASNFNDSIFENLLPVGHYAGFPSSSGGGDKDVIIMIGGSKGNATGRPYAWCRRKTTPVDPTGSLTIELADADYSQNGIYVTINQITISISNSSSGSVSGSISVYMSDGYPSRKYIGEKSFTVAGGGGDNIDILGDKDDPVTYESVTGEPSAEVTVTVGSSTKTYTFNLNK